MISLDTNVLLALIDVRHIHHKSARIFGESLMPRDDVGVSEFTLLELYTLLRNPAVVENTYSPPEAAAACQAFRRHPRWRILGFPINGAAIHDEIWSRVTQTQFPRRRIYDLRLGLSLVHQGVTAFATKNVRDFQDIGFGRVWDPL